MDVLAAALTCAALIGAGYCAWATLPLLARIEKLEEERPRFLAEMSNLLETCDEVLERADAKRKRAENVARRVAAENAPSEAQQGELVFRRGSVIQ